MSPRWYLDENISHRVARVLRDDFSVDAVASHEAGMNGSTDDQQMLHAVTTGRILVTYNPRDFLPLASLWWQMQRDFPGIALLSPRSVPQHHIGSQARAVALADREPWPVNIVDFLRAE